MFLTRLNGWSSLITNATGFLRGLERVHERPMRRAPAWKLEDSRR